MLTKDRQKMSEDLLRETSQVRDILDKDKKARLEAGMDFLQGDVIIFCFIGILDDLFNTCR